MKEASSKCDDIVCTASNVTASASLFDSTNSNSNNSSSSKSKFKLNVKRVAINEPSDACSVQSNYNCTSMREAETESIQTHQHFCAPHNYIHNNNMKSVYVESSRNATSITNDKSMASAEANAPMRYGGAIVRISDLRARGETFLESGLNLRSVNKRLREEHKPCNNKENYIANSNYVTSPEQASLSRSHHTLGNVNCNNSSSQQCVQHAQEESSKSEANNLVNDKSIRDGLEDVTWTNRLDWERQQKTTKNIKRSKPRNRRVSGRNAKNKRQRLEETNNYVNDGCAFSESNDNSNYRWYTVKGRRRLVVNGKTYRGKAAHSLWNKLKKVGTQHTRPTSSTFASDTNSTYRNNSANVIAQPKIVKASEIYLHSTKTRNSEPCTLVQHTLNTETSTTKRKPEEPLTSRAPSQLLQVKVPLRPSALELLRMPKLPLRSGTFDEVGKQKQNNETDEHKFIRAKNELANISKLNNTSSNYNKGYSGEDKMTASGTREVISVIESDDEVNSIMWNNATKHNTLTNNMQTQNSDVHETELESIDSFSSTWDEGDSSICSTYDEKESMHVSNDSISICSDRSCHSHDEDNVVINVSNLKYAGTSKTQSSNVIRETSKIVKNNESQVGGQEVIEYDGWVYPADVFAAMQEAKLNEAKTNGVKQRDKNREIDHYDIHNNDVTPKTEETNVTPDVARQACAGLEIIGCHKNNEHTHAHTNREVPRALIEPAQLCTVPVLVDEDLYINHDVFDCLDSRELAGLFETGDEVGGVRYSAL